MMPDLVEVTLKQEHYREIQQIVQYSVRFKTVSDYVSFLLLCLVEQDDQVPHNSVTDS